MNRSAGTAGTLPEATSAVAGRAAIRVLQARAGDLEALLALESECFSSGPYRKHRFEAAQYRYYLRNPQAIVLVAERQGTVEGSLVGLAGRGVRSRSARILSIAVGAACRRQGVGQRLVQHALERFGARGSRRVYLEIAATAAGAQGLFGTFGFRPVRALPSYYGRSRHGVRMMLTLPSDN